VEFHCWGADVCAAHAEWCPKDSEHAQQYSIHFPLVRSSTTYRSKQQEQLQDHLLAASSQQTVMLSQQASEAKHSQQHEPMLQLAQQV
jgi:hypothetical protein